MSVTLSEIDVVVVDSVTTMIALLDSLSSLAVDPPSLYFDLKGVNLGRHGRITIISFYILPLKKICLVDIDRLRETAFSTTNSSGTSLKSVLESSTTPKVVFDIRNGSDALFSHYKISVDGIKDLQLMELARRGHSKNFVAGLARCIEMDSPVSSAAKSEWQRMKEDASKIYDPKKGGRRGAFNGRPLKPEIMQYCAGGVALLPGLYDFYSAKLSRPGQRFWQVKVREATKDRIKLSQSSGYDGQAADNACGPWDKDKIEEEIDAWNEDVLSKALTDDDDESSLWYDDNDSDVLDDMSARDCIGWEEDMVKNGEYF